MASFSWRNAQVLLFLFCLMHTHIYCLFVPSFISNAVKKIKSILPGGDEKEEEKVIAVPKEDGIFAMVKAFDNFCAGVWITTDFILTAASCLDQDGKLHLKVNDTVDVIVWQMEPTEDTGDHVWKHESNGTFKGKAIFHPQYQREGETTVYDLAFVKAFGKDKKHPIGALCSGDAHKSQLSALGKTENDVKEWTLERATDNDFAIVADGKELNNLSSQGREYKLDPSKQFTARIQISDARKGEGLEGPISETIFSNEGLGAPILFVNDTRYCVGGIVTSKGLKNDEMYITATIVYRLADVNHYFKDAKEILNAAEKESERLN